MQPPAVHPQPPAERGRRRAVRGLRLRVYLLYALSFPPHLTELTADEFRHRGKYFLCLTIGTWCEAIGLALRIALRKDPHSLGLYIAMYMFVVLSVSCRNRPRSS